MRLLEGDHALLKLDLSVAYGVVQLCGAHSRAGGRGPSGRAQRTNLSLERRLLRLQLSDGVDEFSITVGSHL